MPGPFLTSRGGSLLVSGEAREPVTMREGRAGWKAKVSRTTKVFEEMEAVLEAIAGELLAPDQLPPPLPSPPRGEGNEQPPTHNHV